jgi:hypothetical protein
VHRVQDLVDLGAGQVVRAHVPHYQVVVRPVRDKLLSLLRHRCEEGLAVADHLLRVVFELLGSHFLELDC